MARTPAVPPGWLFAIIAMPYGSFNGIVAIALPFLLRRHGYSVERIAGISALAQVPAIWYFLWAPMVDLRFRRRTWIILLGVASGLLTGLALMRTSSAHTTALLVLLVMASVLNQPVSSAVGSLVSSVVPDESRGQIGGWTQAGILGGAVIAGGLSIFLSERLGETAVALISAALIALPGFASLTIREPMREPAPVRTRFTAVVHDVRAALRRPRTWVALCFFLSPIGAGALMNLFSALASDFHASTAVVVWTVGAAGIMTPAGALLGGWICDRYDRWRLYPIAGLTAAVSAAAMLAAPLTPATYIVGAMGYSLTTGFCYAAFMALAFELVGGASAASGTRFTLFMAALNVPVVYMVKLDGWAHTRWGVHGVLAMDAGAGGACSVALLLLLVLLPERVWHD